MIFEVKIVTEAKCNSIKFFNCLLGYGVGLILAFFELLTWPSLVEPRASI